MEKNITITLPHGIHARPAGMIITKLKELNIGKGTLIKDSTIVDLKSILSLMTLGANKGAVVTVKIEGPEAEKAVQMVENVLTGKEGLFL